LNGTKSLVGEDPTHTQLPIRAFAEVLGREHSPDETVSLVPPCAGRPVRATPTGLESGDASALEEARDGLEQYRLDVQIAVTDMAQAERCYEAKLGLSAKRSGADGRRGLWVGR
jgi:hypothetical protein